MGLRSTLTGPTAFAGRGEVVAVERRVKAAVAAVGMVRKARRDVCC